MRLAVLLLAGCGRIGFEPTELTTADASDAPSACGSFGPWSTPVHLSALTSPADDWAPAISPDGTLLLFETLRDSSPDIYGSVRTGASFATPELVPELSSIEPDGSPVWNASGTEVYFDRFTNDFEIAVSTFDGTFSTPVSTGLLGAGPSISKDGLEMFFNTMPFPHDLRRATRASLAAPWVIDDTFDALDTAGADGYPSLTSDGLTLYFESDRSGPLLIWQTTRPAIGAAFGDPTVVDDFAEPGVEYGDPDISADGLTMYLATSQTGDFDIYVSTRACL